MSIIGGAAFPAFIVPCAMMGQEKAPSTDKPKQHFCSIRAGKPAAADYFREGTDSASRAVVRIRGSESNFDSYHFQENLMGKRFSRVCDSQAQGLSISCCCLESKAREILGLFPQQLCLRSCAPASSNPPSDLNTEATFALRPLLKKPHQQMTQ